MNVVDTLISISKEPDQNNFWKDDKKGQCGVSYRGYQYDSEKSTKDGGRFDEEKFNRYIDMRLTFFGEIDGEQTKLKGGEKIMVKKGRLKIKKEQKTKATYLELTINEWERFDGKSNTRKDEGTTSPNASVPADAAASAGKKANPFSRN